MGLGRVVKRLLGLLLPRRKRDLATAGPENLSLESLVGLPLSVRTYSVFISSGDDAVALRNRVERVLVQVFNPQLRDAQIPVRFEARRWERAAAQKASTGAKTNDIFVEQARQSNWVIAILHDKIGKGTEEEILAVLPSKPPELIVLWAPTQKNSEVADFLRTRQNDLLFAHLQDPDSEDGWLLLLQNLVSILLGATSAPQSGSFHELR